MKKLKKEFFFKKQMKKKNLERKFMKKLHILAVVAH